MNYYIQGDAANAERIKAAFEKLGYSTSLHTFFDEDTVFITLNGNICECNYGGAINELIKTHPDYQELELPIEPKFKFKVGDWIVQNDNGTVSQITKTINGKDEYGEYRAYEHTNGYFAACFENEYHLWSIADAKDGDVIYSLDSKQPFIYKVRPQFSQARGYCCINKFGDFAVWNTNKCIICTDKYIPATKEQRDLLFAKMKEAGYEWDADKKELRKIKPHYDIKNFKPFDKVLVRDADDGKWCCNWFSHYIGDGGVYRFVTTKCGYAQCIPFEGNEHLLGTTDMPDEMYINW